MLLLDEPCSALDPRSTETIERLIVKLREEVAVVIVTHNLQQAFRVADHVAFMYLGELVEYGPADQVFGSPRAQAHARLRRGVVRVSARLLAGLPLLLLALAPLLSGCESTQAKSARLERDGRAGSSWARRARRESASRDVRAVATSVLQDENGTAVVVVLRNRSPRPLGRVPVAIDVSGPGGRSVYRNDAPGLDPSLVEATGVPASGELVWVNDQVTPAGAPKRVEARVGAERGRLAARAAADRADAAETDRGPRDRRRGGRARHNRSDVEQRRLVVSCVARRGDGSSRPVARSSTASRPASPRASTSSSSATRAVRA